MARKPKLPTPPTIEDIMGRKSDAERFWGPLHAEQEIDNQYFQLQRPVNAPAAYQSDIYYPATGNSIVTTLADHVAGDSPQIKVPEANQTLKAGKRSESLEQCYVAALTRFRDVQRADPIRALVISAGWSGQMISQGPIFDSSVWCKTPTQEKFSTDGQYAEAMDEYEARQRTEWPFFWKIHDPRFVFPDPGTHGRKWVIVFCRRNVGDISAQWPDWDRKLNPGDPPLPDMFEVEWIEYWDCHYRAYLAGGQLIDKIRPHRYGKPPFQIRSAGLGKESPGVGLVHEMYRSMLFPVRSPLDAEIQSASQVRVMYRNTAWSTMLTPTGSGFTQMEPGKVVPMRNAADIAATKPVSEYRADVIAGLMEEKRSIGQDIEQGTYPNVVKGIKASGINSGYGQNSLVAQAKVRFGPVVVELQSLLSEFISDFARCVENVVGEPVPIWGPLAGGFVDTVLKPSDINGYYFNLVTVNPKLPVDRATEIEVGNLLLQVGAIDMDTYISDFAGYEQPGKMRLRVLRDKIMASPEFTRIATVAAAMETGIIDYALDVANRAGVDPVPFLQVLGFGVPGQQQMPGAVAPVNPAMAAAQHTPSNAANATQGTPSVPSSPPPGSPMAVRDAAAPGVSIG